jgi:DhnA family fructose-bisphosphate aldolase class Ia
LRRVQSQPRKEKKKARPISKIFNTKRAHGMVQVLECLPKKNEALN